MKKPIKIIDLFAGPGGLGEGFSAVQQKGQRAFEIGVSVEKEASAHATLTLRAFFRQFLNGEAPDDYYSYLRGDITKNELFDKWPVQAKSAACETLEKPRALGEDNEIIDRVILSALKTDDPWVLIGGPPCQAYSLVGRARNKGIKDYDAEKDHRHFLYQEYLRIIAKFQPAVFVMENVKGMLSSKVGGKAIFPQILSDLQNPSETYTENSRGPKYRVFSLSTEPQKSTEPQNDLFKPVYEPRDFVIRSEEFGIPQTRHRVILLGVRVDISTEHKQLTISPATPPSIKQVIQKIPKLRSGLSKEPDSPERWFQVLYEIQNDLISQFENTSSNQALVELLNRVHKNFRLPAANRGSRYIPFRANSNPYGGMPDHLIDWYQDKRLTGYINHESRGHMRSDLARYLFCSVFAQQGSQSSPRLNDFPEMLLPDHANKKSGSFVDRFKVQIANKPGSTITSHISKDGHYFIHYDPTQCRSLSVREAARIQTFPDNYFFEGNRTQQYVQVGNAVPPILANKIAKIVYDLLR